MLSIVRTLPKRIVVAVSGGVDSMVSLHFLSRKHDVTAVHFVHCDSDSAAGEKAFVQRYCAENGINLAVEPQRANCPPGTSKEEHWRNGRYEFFKQFDMPVITGHTLDDAVEWYLFTALNGEGRFMEYAHANIVRPFLLTTKAKIEAYAANHLVPFIPDPTNLDPTFAARNRIRLNILPEALKVNPGLYKVVKKRLLGKIDKPLDIS